MTATTGFGSGLGVQLPHVRKPNGLSLQEKEELTVLLKGVKGKSVTARLPEFPPPEKKGADEGEQTIRGDMVGADFQNFEHALRGSGFQLTRAGWRKEEGKNGAVFSLSLTFKRAGKRLLLDEKQGEVLHCYLSEGAWEHVHGFDNPRGHALLLALRRHGRTATRRVVLSKERMIKIL